MVICQNLHYQQILQFHKVMKSIDRRPIVFIDVQIGRTKMGRIKLQLFSHYLPQTCQNFRQLCTGQYLKQARPTGFKQSCLYQISLDYVRGGDYNKNDGTSGQSAHGNQFLQKSQLPEQARVKCQKQLKNKYWILSMVKNKNQKVDSVFQINYQWSKQLQKDMIPFGHAIEQNSYQVLKSLSQTTVNEDKKPKIPTIIYQCGQM